MVLPGMFFERSKKQAYGSGNRGASILKSIRNLKFQARKQQSPVKTIVLCF
jgi:hypothetical protein